MTQVSAVAAESSRIRSEFLGLASGPGKPRSLAWLNNFEAERFWTPANTVQIPQIGSPQGSAVVNRMEEFGFFLAQGEDLLILRESPDPAFVAYVQNLGFDPPRVLAIQPDDRQKPISLAVLQSDVGLRELKALSGDYALIAYGRTRYEDEILALTGLPGIGPDASVCERVNSKVYGRKLARTAGLALIEGAECESLEELEAGMQEFGRSASASTPFVLKESMGVSGKGLVVLDSPEKASRIMDLLRRKKSPGAQYSFVLEWWVDKTKDINYQIFIDRTGKVELLSLKQIVTEHGVHRGHRFPCELTPSEFGVYEHAAQKIGYALWQDGYYGLAGIDSIIGCEGTVYPLLEINARFNMSTFLLTLEERLTEGYSGLAKFFPLILTQKLPFETLLQLIGDDVYDISTQRGMVILNFATVNCNVNEGSRQAASGRLYVMIVGDDVADAERIDRSVADRLRTAQLLA